jgi:integrase
MKGRTFKRCGCRNPETKKKYSEGKCPQLKKKQHGAWWFRYDAPRGADGKRRRPLVGPFTTERDADKALAEELANVSHVGQAVDRSLTVGVYLEKQWLPGKKSLARSTYADYEEIVRLYLKPALGHLRLVDLCDRDAHEMYAAISQINCPQKDGERQSELLRRLMEVRAASAKKQHTEGEASGRKQTRPISAARIKKVHAVLSSAMGTAVKTKRLTYNPVEHVELPRIKGRRSKPLVWTTERVRHWLETGKAPGPVMVWTAEQTGAFLDFAAEERLYALFHLVAFRGPRRAEVAGLPWTDTDLDDSETLTIRETRPDDEYDDTKSEAGERTVSLDRMTLAVLRRWRTHQREERLSAGPEIWVDSGRVFTREDGSALRPEWISLRFEALIERYNTIRRRHFNEGWPVDQIARRHRVSQRAAQVAIDRGPLPPIRFHDLRHGAATLSLLGKVDMKVISATLGHSRSSFTADTYASVLPEVAKSAAEAVAAVVPLRRDGHTMATPDTENAPAEIISLGGGAGSGGGSGI